MTCRPGHAPRHPDFEPGNTVGQRHGANSPRVIRPLAESIAAEECARSPWLARPTYARDLMAYAWAEAQCDVLRDWIDEHGLLSDKGTQAFDRLERIERRATHLREGLGLRPAALVKIVAKLAEMRTLLPAGAGDDFEAMLAESRRILASRADELEAGDE